MKHLYPPTFYSGAPASPLSPGFFPRLFLLYTGHLLFLTAAFAQTNPQQYRCTGAGGDKN